MNWQKLLIECSQRMRREVLPFFGSPDAAVSFGKGAGGDVIKKIDLVAEKTLIDVLENNEVSCILVSEEAGIEKIGKGPYEFYLTVDPVDGTTNALRGLPFMAVSIAVSRKPYLKYVETALVLDILHDVTYTAQRDKGAYRNGKRIEPSQIISLEEAVVGVDFNAFNFREIATSLEDLLVKTRHLRHFGANALEVCYVADGTTEAFIDIRGKLRVTDVAAAYMILVEAGGICVTPEGTELNVSLAPHQRVAFIAAANNKMYDNIKEVLA